MGGSYPTYIGIDVQASQKPYFYSVTNSELEIVACGHGRLPDLEAYLSGQSSALVAVNGPICVQSSNGRSLQTELFDEPNPDSRNVQVRTGDRVLSDRGFPLAVMAAKIPSWVERSLELAGVLYRLGYSLYGCGDNSRTFFETQCDAGYWLAIGALPFGSRSLEGRLQRQLILCEFGFRIQDPMIFLEEFTRHRLRTSQLPMEQVLPVYELRAMYAAATAMLLDTRIESIECVGEPGGGQLILPKAFSRG